MFADLETRELNIRWSQPPQRDINGVLTGYQVCSCVCLFVCIFPTGFQVCCLFPMSDAGFVNSNKVEQ